MSDGFLLYTFAVIWISKGEPVLDEAVYVLNRSYKASELRAEVNEQPVTAGILSHIVSCPNLRIKDPIDRIFDCDGARTRLDHHHAGSRHYWPIASRPSENVELLEPEF